MVNLFCGAILKNLYSNETRTIISPSEMNVFNMNVAPNWMFVLLTHNTWDAWNSNGDHDQSVVRHLTHSLHHLFAVAVRARRMYCTEQREKDIRSEILSQILRFQGVVWRPESPQVFRIIKISGLKNSKRQLYSWENSDIFEIPSCSHWKNLNKVPDSALSYSERYSSIMYYLWQDTHGIYLNETLRSVWTNAFDFLGQRELKRLISKRRTQKQTIPPPYST